MAIFFGRYSESELQSAMSRAIDEAVHIGRSGLRQKYGFRPAKKFLAVVAGHHFDSKALVAAAAGCLNPPVVLTADDFSGGVVTTRILDACDVSWIDTDQLADLPGLGTDSAPDESNAVTPASDRPGYWWANQGNNYSTVIEQGSLWAPDVRADGQPGHEDWQALRLMRPGDHVFHYASQQLRAVSIVVAEGVSANRPPGYQPIDGYPHGTLVLVEPCIVDMEVGLDALRSVFPAGVGPMNSTGNPGRGYIAPIPPTIGGPLSNYLCGGSLAIGTLQKLLQAEGAAATRRSRNFMTTDIAGTAFHRAEQRYLRQALLDRFGSRCAICGRVLPENLLIAAHIKLRSETDEAGRLDFDAAAMLACSLGCDALFELGYITVDIDGRVRPASTVDPALEQVLKSLSGARCLAFSDATAVNFQFHRQRHGNSAGL
ncbi:MAG: hypothetical protein NTU93_12205 [Arthrobacter sp.]|nr:hypothetical protein [Arthrobacter sp.]